MHHCQCTLLHTYVILTSLVGIGGVPFIQAASNQHVTMISFRILAPIRGPKHFRFYAGRALVLLSW